MIVLGGEEWSGNSMVFKITDKVRNFYGETDYTIMDGLLSQKGILTVRNDVITSWKNVYYYREGFISMRVDGRQARSFAKENGIEIRKAD